MSNLCIGGQLECPWPFHVLGRSYVYGAETWDIRSYYNSQPMQKCGLIVWVMNALTSTGIRFVMNAGSQISSRWLVLWLQDSLYCLILDLQRLFIISFYNFLLISIVNFLISLSQSMDPSIHLTTGGDIHIDVLSYGSARWYSTMTVPCQFWKFTMSSRSFLGAILTPIMRPWRSVCANYTL